MWEHFEQFVYYAAWAWRFVIARSFDAFSEVLVIKDFGVEPLSLFESLGFIFVRVKGSGVCQDMLACSQG